MSQIEDHQWGKDPDVWSQALWVGAALSALKLVANTPGLERDAESARYWVARLPDEVKAKWPGTFPEFPYIGEPEGERVDRASRDRQVRGDG